MTRICHKIVTLCDTVVFVCLKCTHFVRFLTLKTAILAQDYVYEMGSNFHLENSRLMT